MLLTITTTYNPATDIGYLLHKSPFRCQEFHLSFGTARLFYPEATKERCTVAMLIDVDPIKMVRGRQGGEGSSFMDQYVNDRPYVASSFLSVAIAQVFGSALKGKSTQRPDLVDRALPLNARISVLPSRGGEQFLLRLFEPLGYAVKAERGVLDDKFTEWGNSPYYDVELQKTTTISELLSHLSVLVPVLDNMKHYYIDDAEVDKLLRHGQGWLAQHPERESIVRRYLKYRMSLAREALSRLAEESPAEVETDESAKVSTEDEIENSVSLNEERLGTVLSVLKQTDARQVIDLGCGEGKLLRLLMKEKQFDKIVGMDVSIRSLELAAERLKLNDQPTKQRERMELMHGSLMYRDRRFEGFEAAAVVEVIEHMDPPRLAAFERVLFEYARPKTVILTTPNREYNAAWRSLPAGQFRHTDHRFEWTRTEFHQWAGHIAERFGYDVRFLAVGVEKEHIGAPTQMAVFTLKNKTGSVSSE